MTGFAARRFLVFHDLFPIFIPKMNAVGIIMLMRQVFLTITHVGSIMTYIIPDAVRKPGHVLIIIWYYNPPSGHTEACIYVFPIVGWHFTSSNDEIWAEVKFRGSMGFKTDLTWDTTHKNGEYLNSLIVLSLKLACLFLVSSQQKERRRKSS